MKPRLNLYCLDDGSKIWAVFMQDECLAYSRDRDTALNNARELLKRCNDVRIWNANAAMYLPYGLNITDVPNVYEETARRLRNAT